MKILLTHGHGGTDSGSIGADGGYEKDRTYTLVNAVATYLTNAGHSVTVVQEKNARGQFALSNRNGYDLAVSTHFNASAYKNATGTEVLYKNSNDKTLASNLSASIANAMGVTNRGAKIRTDLYMMNIGFDALIETCFHDFQPDLDAYNNNFTAIVNAIGSVISGASSNGNSSGGSSANSNRNVNVRYQVFTNKWLPDITNYGSGSNGYAGEYGKPICCLRANTVGKAEVVGKLEYRLRPVGGNWLDWVTDRQKDKNGDDFAGLPNKPIDGIQIRLVGVPATAKYRVHIKGGNWLPWVENCGEGANGFAGLPGKIIDGIQIYI